MDTQNSTLGQQSIAPAKVIPLLQQLSRVEDLTSSLAVRLDPITNHIPENTSETKTATFTVTGRLAQLGDVLQYLLDHIEL